MPIIVEEIPGPAITTAIPTTRIRKVLLLDFRNNVIYNWSGSHAGYNADSKSITRMNYVGNFLIPGPDSENTGIAYSTGSPYNKAYFHVNYYNYEKPANQWNLEEFDENWSQQQIEAYKQNCCRWLYHA
jgi:hypothetical protein